MRPGLSSSAVPAAHRRVKIVIGVPLLFRRGEQEWRFALNTRNNEIFH
jgi:hypothetical protein